MHGAYACLLDALTGWPLFWPKLSKSWTWEKSMQLCKETSNCPVFYDMISGASGKESQDEGCREVPWGRKQASRARVHVHRWCLCTCLWSRALAGPEAEMATSHPSGQLCSLFLSLPDCDTRSPRSLHVLECVPMLSGALQPPQPPGQTPHQTHLQLHEQGQGGHSALASLQNTGTAGVHSSVPPAGFRR